MDSRTEIKEFLASRRAKVTPSQAGLPTYGTHRRVKGLRREEAPMLAGVSVDYYTRLLDVITALLPFIGYPRILNACGWPRR